MIRSESLFAAAKLDLMQEILFDVHRNFSRGSRCKKFYLMYTETLVEDPEVKIDTKSLKAEFHII